MTDRLTPEQRRRCMQANRCRGTWIEQMMADELKSRGIRYRRNDRTVRGKPDFCFKMARLAVFCDGDFWHGREWGEDYLARHPMNDYWVKKIERNRQRDHEVDDILVATGWTVMRFWESDLRRNVAECADKIERHLTEYRAARSRQIYEYDTQYDNLLMAAEDEIPYCDGENE